ncbi:MAG TPA: hypothetical protein VKT80_12995 [Chloroflexota bacterium]|nr:hypothetical protein [Chloroflexota bacterium]
MRRWNDRPATPAQFDVNRIRLIGEWGHASRHIGSRWETVGLELLRERVAEREPVAFLAICADEELAGILASTGSKNPDAVLAFSIGDSIALQPADLKWSLDVADYRQISAPILAGLLAQVPSFCAAIRDRLPVDQQDWPWLPRDGFFFSPKSVANERFVTSPENRRQEYPIEAAEVLFQTVDSFEFFEPMPGWSTARELARLDGATRGLPYLDTADRYYHLGRGVAGALANLDGSIFDEEEDVDPAREVELFQTFVKSIGPPSTGLVIERLGGIMRVRQATQRDLRDLARTSLTFKDFAEEVVLAGRSPEGATESVIRRSWGEVYRSIMDRVDLEIRAAGRKLRTSGATDVQALDVLKDQREIYGRRLRARARKTIESTESNRT